jgi:hypothetical protein
MTDSEISSGWSVGETRIFSRENEEIPWSFDGKIFP